MATKTTSVKKDGQDDQVSVDREAIRALAAVMGVLIEQMWPGAPALTRERLMALRQSVQEVEEELK